MGTEYRIGDLVRTKKPHACGGDEWRIERVGADFRLRCVVCGREIMLPRSSFERILKKKPT